MSATHFATAVAHPENSPPTDTAEVRTMANPEHVEILKEGVEAWNQWRKDNPGVRPDLRGAAVQPHFFLFRGYGTAWW